MRPTLLVSEITPKKLAWDQFFWVKWSWKVIFERRVACTHSQSQWKFAKKQFHYTKGHFQLYHLRHTIQSEKWSFQSFQKSQFPNPSARRSFISDSGKLTVSRAHQLLFAGSFAAIPSHTMCKCSTALQHCVVVASNRRIVIFLASYVTTVCK